MKDVKNLKIAYIGGGSRGWAWQLMGDLALEPALCGEVRLYDIDGEAARRNAVIGERMGQAPEARSSWKYLAADTLKDALTGCDFVVISILPGTFEEMESDVHAPEQYGIYQSVGDTTGPGGLLRSLRTAPMFEEIARAVEKYSPGAWVINYTNPMAQCVRTMYRTFPGIKAFGCCHEVFGTQELLCEALAAKSGEPVLPRQALRTTVQGVNHFTWITQAKYRGEDLFPIYKDFALAHRESGFHGDEKRNWMNSLFACGHRVKFELFLTYGYIAAAGDRHLAEFNPGMRYLKNPDTVREYQFSLTPVSYRREDLKTHLQKAEALYNGTQAAHPEPSGEEGVAMMKALLGLGDLVTNVNLPNRGQISNLPMGTVVETNARFSGDSVEPLQTGEMPQAPLTLSMPAVTAQEMIDEAVARRSVRYAFPAFWNDPLTCGLSAAQARCLYMKMLEKTKGYLSEYELSF